MERLPRPEAEAGSGHAGVAGEVTALATVFGQVAEVLGNDEAVVVQRDGELGLPGRGARQGQGGERRRELLPWSRMNALLGIAAHWNEANVKLILNGQAVLPDLYVDPVANLNLHETLKNALTPMPAR